MCRLATRSCRQAVPLQEPKNNIEFHVSLSGSSSPARRFLEKFQKPRKLIWFESKQVILYHTSCIYHNKHKILGSTPLTWNFLCLEFELCVFPWTPMPSLWFLPKPTLPFTPESQFSLWNFVLHKVLSNGSLRNLLSLP